MHVVSSSTTTPPDPSIEPAFIRVSKSIATSISSAVRMGVLDPPGTTPFRPRPFGIPNGRGLKGVVPGGSSTPILTADEIDVAMDFDTLMKAGSMLGSGGVVVLDETTCIVKFALRTMKFYQHESCGWCIPCREGTDWLKKTLIRFHAGGGLKKDIDNMYYLSENMLGRTFCPLGDAAAMPTMAFIKKFRQEFEDHLDGKPCPFEKAAEPVLA